MLKILLRSTLVHRSIGLPVKITACSFSSAKLDPYVNPKYSYTFGRGTVPLMNENINYFLGKLEQEPKKELILSAADNKNISNHQFVEDVRKLASGIYNNLGLRRGDTICLWSLNCYDWLKIFFACQSIGITVCPVNPYYREQELAYALIKCKAKALFLPGSESTQNLINKFLHIFNSDHVQSGLKDKGHIRSVVFIDENQSQSSFKYESHQLENLMASQKLDNEILERVDGDDPCVIMYTSGTTGDPKGVVLSNFSVINNANVIGEYVESIDCSVVPLPLFHSFALTCAAEVMVCKGIKTVLTGYRFDTKSVVESILRENAGFLMVTPTMMIDIANYVKKNKIDLYPLKIVLTGAASFPSELVKIFKEAIPSLEDLRVGYGMTETSPVVSMSKSIDEQVYKTNTVGRAIEYVEVKIVDPETEKTVELGEEGEIYVRGYNVMLGYFEDEEKTKETITPNRWLKTGDRGTMNKSGFIKISGRTKELIIKGGENIYPAEVENILQSHPNVLEASVFAVPDKRLGEVVGCWIKLNDPQVKTTAEDIQSYCKSLASSYKVPTYVMFVDLFPMTSTGKVKKFELQKITCEKLGIEQPNKK